MNDNFKQLLDKISEHFAIELEIDKNRACAIRFDDKITIQVELDETQENLLFFCSIAQIPAGTFRKNLLLQALKENDKYPYIAKLAYFEKENSLALYHFFNFSKFKMEAMLDFITIFADLAILYYNAIASGQPFLINSL